MELVSKFSSFNKKLITSEKGLSAFESLDCSLVFVRNELSAMRTQYKRQKQFEKSGTYAQPQELAVGLRYDSDHQSLNAHLEMVQCKYQHISLIETLRSVFARANFKNLFFNSSDEQIPGVYSSFRSGSIYKNSEFFKTHPDSIQIQISTDDLEICNPLGSKRTLHKITVFYFTIQNVPHKYLSKLDNIYLITLCNSDDLRT